MAYDPVPTLSQTPPSPHPFTLKLYFLVDGQLYQLDENGKETLVFNILASQVFS